MNETPDEWLEFKEVSDQEVRLYRTKTHLIDLVGPLKFMVIKSEGLIPVMSGNRVIGCMGDLTTDDDSVFVELLIDYQTPERLELENGDSGLSAEGVFTVMSYNETEEGLQPTSSKLKSIRLVKDNPEAIVLPIGKPQ